MDDYDYKFRLWQVFFKFRLKRDLFIIFKYEIKSQVWSVIVSGNNCLLIDVRMEFILRLYVCNIFFLMGYQIGVEFYF